MNSGDTIIVLVAIITINLSMWYIASAVAKASKQLSDISKALSQVRDIQKKQLRNK